MVLYELLKESIFKVDIIAFPNHINTLIKTQAKLIGSAWRMLDSS